MVGATRRVSPTIGVVEAGKRAFDRLHLQRDFRLMREEGRRSNGTHLSLVYRPNPEGRLRLGLIVSKAVGKAVQRNRLKRRLREVVHQLGPQVRRGSDLLLIARPTAAQVGFTELRESVTSLLSRAGLLSGPADEP